MKGQGGAFRRHRRSDRRATAGEAEGAGQEAGNRVARRRPRGLHELQRLLRSLRFRGLSQWPFLTNSAPVLLENLVAEIQTTVADGPAMKAAPDEAIDSSGSAPTEVAASGQIVGGDRLHGVGVRSGSSGHDARCRADAVVADPDPRACDQLRGLELRAPAERAESLFSALAAGVLLAPAAPGQPSDPAPTFHELMHPLVAELE